MADASHASYLPPILAFCAGAVIAVPLFRRVGLSAVLGYLAAGVVIGPEVLGIVRDANTIRGVAEIGVVLLLFLVGLELQPSRLVSMRGDIFGAGLAQMAITSALFAFLGWQAGLSVGGAVAVGVALALSATAIALQVLEERGDSGEAYGRRTFSILLFQDLSIAPILAAIPLMATTVAVTTPGQGWIRAGVALGAIAALVLIGRYALNPLFRILAKSGAREVMTAAALLVVLGAAVLMEQVGLSMAMGAFIAGVMLAESNFRHELEADIEPFRGVLLGLFFMAVGMSIDADVVRGNWLWLLVATPLVLLAKIAISALLLRWSCSSWSEALRAGALLSPAGEFAFVLVPLATGLALLTPAQAGFVTALAALTMLLGPLVAKGLDMHLDRREAGEDAIDESYEGANGAALIIGFGRFGQVVTQTLLTQRIEVTVIDKDVESIQAAARFGFRIYYGDGTRLDVLRAAGAARAKVVALCIDDQKAALRVVELLKAEFPQARIIARAYDRRHAIELRKAGVDRFIRETFESALYFGRVTLETMGLSADAAIEISADVRRRDLIRLEAQAQGDMMSGKELLHTSADHGVVPEPLSPPKQASKALNEETRAAVEAEPGRAAHQMDHSIATSQASR
jgi:monovalent cation:proton antiporter-2 (CPA2) family protein